MLKSEHLRYRINTPHVKPGFIDPQSPFLLELAGELICIYTSSVQSGMTRLELENVTASIIRSSFDVKLASGLNKLLLDRCEFSSAAQLDYPELRRKSFLRSAELLNSGNFSAAALQQCAGGNDLYGDLPDFEKLSAFEPVCASALLHRYNLAQAQGLLFYASQITLMLKKTEASELRKLLKTIKFFRLMAHFRRLPQDTLQIDITGPYSIFGTTAKYALQLANLLPAIVSLPFWKLTAQLKIKGRELTMLLSHKNALVSHYRNLAGYIPEEIRIYHRTFNDKQKNWQITGDTPFLDAGDQEVIFPDLSFRSAESGTLLHLELFHRWHASMLARRIALLASHPELPLLLGIDRALVKDEKEFEQLFSNCPEVREKCWLFRDFPGVSTTVSMLKKAEKRLQ